MSRKHDDDDNDKPITVDYYDFITRGMSSYRSTSAAYWAEVERKRMENIAAALTSNINYGPSLVRRFTKQTGVIRDFREQSYILQGAVQHDYARVLSKDYQTSVDELNSLSADTKFSVLLLRLVQTKHDIDRHIVHALEGTLFDTFNERKREITVLSLDCDALIAKISDWAPLSIEQKIDAFDGSVLEELVHPIQWSNLSENVLNQRAFPNFGGSYSDFQVSLLTVELLCFGMYLHVYAQYYGAHIFSQITEYFYNTKQLYKYNEYVDYASNNILRRFRPNNFNRMQEIVTSVRNLQHIQLHYKDVEQFALENVINLDKHLERLNAYCVANLVADIFLPSLPQYHRHLDFSTSNTTTGMAPWIKGSNVSYAVQFVEQKVDETAEYEIRSALSPWTDDYQLTDKANPFVNDVFVDFENFPYYANGRLVWRQFNYDIKTAKIVAFLGLRSRAFRDIDRDLYDVAVLGDLPKVKYYLEHGANVSTLFEHRQMTLHAVAHNVTSDHSKVALELLKNAATEHEDVRTSIVDSQDDYGRTPIYFAAESGNIELVHILLEHNATASIASNKRNHQIAPLHAAAYAGHANIIEVLMKKVKDLNARTVEGFTALHFAVAFNRESIVALLLADARTDVNAKSYFRCECTLLFPPKIVSILATSANVTPLHMAYAIGSEQLVKLLLEKGAYIYMRTSDGSNVMHYAALNNNVVLIPDNCSSSSLINIPNAYDLTPLYIAFMHNNIEFADQLVHHCANANIQLTNKRTMLHLAALCSDAHIAQILLDRGASVYSKDSNRVEPLEYAVALGDTAMVELLFSHDASPNAKDPEFNPLIQSIFLINDDDKASKMLDLFIKYNMSIHHAGDLQYKNSLLHFSSAFGSVPLVRILLNNILDTLPVDLRNVQNDTSLHVALRIGCVECANVLIDQANASVALHGNANWTALNYAIAGKVNNSQTRIFAEKFMSTTDECHNRANAYQVLAQNVLQAAQYGKFDVNEFYIEHCKFLGPVLQDPIHQNNNPIDLKYLSALAKYGDAHALKTLFPLKRSERFGLHDFRQLPLIEALKSSNTSVEVVRFLHDQGYVLTPDRALRKYFPNSTNWNALNYTILGNGDRTILEFVAQKIQFKQKKIEIVFPELRGEHNETLMHLAAQANKVDIAQFLLEKQVDLNVVDRDGYSPLHIAARYGNLEMLQFLIENGANAQATTATHAQTPIIEAILNNGTVEVVQYLINNASAVIPQPRQVMLTAAQLNKAQVAIFLCEQVLQEGFCMSVRSNESKLNALDYAAMHNNMLLAEYLLNQNNGTYAIDARAIYCAVEYEGQLQMIEYLHSMGAPIEDEDAESVIACAIVNQKYQVAKFLIDAGANVHKEGKSKRTPLHEAVLADQRDLIRMLMRKSTFIIDAKDSEGFTPIDYIFVYRRWEALRYFLFNYPLHDTSLIHLRTLKNDYFSVEWLVERGGDVNIFDNFKNTPLHLAAEKGFTNVVRILLGSRCINISIRNVQNQTALDLAEANNHTDIVNLLKHHSSRKRRQIEYEQANTRSIQGYHNGASTKHSSFLITSAGAIGSLVSYVYERIGEHASMIMSFAFGNPSGILTKQVIANIHKIPNSHGTTRSSDISKPLGVVNARGIPSNIDLNSTLLLLDVLIRKYCSGKRYTRQHSQGIKSFDARICALVLVERFQRELTILADQSEPFDTFEFYRTVENFILNEQYNKIEGYLRTTVRKRVDKKQMNEIELTRMINTVLIESFTSGPDGSEISHFCSTNLMFSNDIFCYSKNNRELYALKHELEVNKLGQKLI